MSLRYAALRALVVVGIGIALARVAPVSPWVPLAVAVGSFALFRVTRGLSLYLSLAAAAMAWAVARAPVPPAPMFYESPSFSGVVVEEPGRDVPIRLEVRLSPPMSGRVLVWLSDSILHPEYGDEVVVMAHVRPFSYPRNPGVPDWNERMQRRGYVGRATVSGLRLRLTGANRGALLTRAVVIPARRHLRELITRLFPDETGAVLLALLAGDRSEIPDETMATMRESGLVHVLAVSGLHVGIIAGLIWMLLALLGVRGWWRFAVGTLVIGAYVVFVGARAPAIRAGIMAVAVALAWTGQRRVEPGAGLGVAGLALLLVDPNALFDLGTQLSFAAAAGIIAAIVATEKMRFSGPPFTAAMARPGMSLARALIVSAAAFTATAPVLLREFGRVQPLAIPASVPAVMLTGAIIPLGGLAVLLSSVWQPLGAVLAESVRVLVGLLTGLAGFVATQDWAVPRLAGSGLLVLPWTAAVLFLLLHWRQRRARVAALGVLLAGLTVTTWTAAFRPQPERAWFLDPGRGDAVVFDDGAGHTLLVDAGVNGPGVVRDYLRSRGIGRVDVVLVTHPDIDHYGGLLDLDDNVSVGTLVLSTPRGSDDYTGLLDRLRKAGTDVVCAAAGTRLEFGRFRFEFAWPGETARRLHAAGLASTNDVSLVAVVERSGYRMLLAGDMDRPELLAGRDVRADLLKSPHHGSVTGNSPGLFELVRPGLVVVMGRWPTPAGLEERLAGSETGLVNTREVGAVGVEFGRGEPVFRDFRGRRLAIPGYQGVTRSASDTCSEPR